MQGALAQPKPAMFGVSWSATKGVSAVIWTASLSTSWLFMQALGMEGAALYVGAMMVQICLSVLESPYWTGKRYGISVVAVVIDTLLNAGGTWVQLQHLDNTHIWHMLASLAPNVQVETGSIATVIVSLALGYILAAAPERVWRW